MAKVKKITASRPTFDADGNQTGMETKHFHPATWITMSTAIPAYHGFTQDRESEDETSKPVAKAGAVKTAAKDVNKD